MEQIKIDKYLRWLEKGIRIFVASGLCLDIGTMIFAGAFLYFYGRDVTVTLNAWQLGLGFASNMIKIVIFCYAIFGKWHIEYKKKTPMDPTVMGKDW